MLFIQKNKEYPPIHICSCGVCVCVYFYAKDISGRMYKYENLPNDKRVLKERIERLPFHNILFISLGLCAMIFAT